jgi:ABC-2 type transport system permease protein
LAVYERTYRAYEGTLTPQNKRFLVLPRYAFTEVFRSKIFIAFLVACFLVPLVLTLMIYMPHNSTFIKTIETVSGGAVELQFKVSYYFWAFMIPQGFFSFFLSLIVGPALVSADMRNNAIPLYLSRPFSRKDYILGKLCVLVFLLSAITWVPGLGLFALHGYLEGFSWFVENIRTAFAIFVGSWVIIILLSLVSLAISAYMKWKPVAAAAYFGLILFTAFASGMINFLFRTSLGSLLNISDMVKVVWTQLFAIDAYSDVPAWSAWLSLAAFGGIFLMLLVRKIKAYEVVT